MPRGRLHRRDRPQTWRPFSRAPFGRHYCAFHKHANSKVQKPPLQLRFSLPSIIIMITSNEPWNTETHKTDRNPLITNHKPWPFELVKVNVCFLRGPLRWLTAAKTAIVSWLLNFRIRMFVKSAVKHDQQRFIKYKLWIRSTRILRLEKIRAVTDLNCRPKTCPPSITFFCWSRVLCLKS